MDGARIADKTHVLSPPAPVPLRVRPLRREWDVRNLRLALLLFLPTECRFRVSPKQRERLRDIIAPMRVHSQFESGNKILPRTAIHFAEIE